MSLYYCYYQLLICLPASMPLFSFDKIPLAFHSSNSSAMGWSSSQLQTLASRYHMVTFEKTLINLPSNNGDPKYHQIERFVPQKTLVAPYDSRNGLYACQNNSNLSKCGCCVEDGIISQARALKAINPNVFIVVYLNTVIAYPWYRATRSFAHNPQYWLRGINGKVLHNSDRTGPSNYTWALFNLSNPHVSSMWQQTCLNLTKTGVIDSCFLDGCVNKYHGVAASEATILMESKLKMMKELQEIIQSPLLCGSTGVLPAGVGGTQAEGWGRTGNFGGRDIPLLMKAMRMGRVFQAHGYASCFYKDPTHPAVQNELSAFLVAMDKNAFFLCGPWENNAPENIPVVFDYPLGAPLGNATFNKGVWRRRFASGTNVSFNTVTNKGAVTWADPFSA